MLAFCNCKTYFKTYVYAVEISTSVTNSLTEFQFVHFCTLQCLSEVTVRRGDNITLYCDCKMGDGELTVWFRNCSNENHTVLVLTAEAYFQQFGKTRFIWTKNISSDSYDLTIINVTYSDEGFYYCANEKNKVEDKKQVNVRSLYNYSSIIRKISVSTGKYLTQMTFCETDEDVCYAALEIQQSSMKPQRKRTTTQTSDFSTYSTVNKL
uniref:Ig-like domain-containing protein n=1 Tax=Oryzias latipes TaxID=8090 RepID=A0A3B3H7M1_ORYLA